MVAFPDGRAITLHKPGGVAGWSALVSPAGYTASVTCLTDCTFITLFRQRAITSGPKKRGGGDQDHAQYFQGAQQKTSFFAGRRQAKTEKGEVNPWVDFLQSALAMAG